MQDLGILKNCLHSRSGGKKLGRAQSMVEKTFLPPRNHDTPPSGKIMVRPLLQIPYSLYFDEILYDGCYTETNLNIYIFGTIECNITSQ